MKQLLTYLALAVITFGSSYGQKTSPQASSTFNVDGYKFSTQNLYPSIKQSDIKAIRVSYRVIGKSDPANSLLFYPEKRDGIRVNLTDLLLWAVKEKGLNAYDVYSKSEFEKTLSWDEFVEQSSWRLEDSIVSSEVKSFLIIESTIYNHKNQVIAVRPIGLCPIRTHKVQNYYDELVEVQSKICWLRFTDIMHLLNNYKPGSKVKGVNSVLHFFTKNMYKGEYLYDVYGFESIQVDGDSKQTSSLNGIFVNPNNKLYHGGDEAGVKVVSKPFVFNEVNQSAVAYAKYVYSTISENSPQNHQIFFPAYVVFGQENLATILMDKTLDNSISVYKPYSSNSWLDEIMSHTDLMEAMDGLDVELNERSPFTGRDTTIIIKGSPKIEQIKEYTLIDVHFFDHEGNKLGTRPLGLIPVRVFSRNWDYNADIIKQPVCFFPFGSPDVIEFLSTNYAQPLDANHFYSYITFFNQGKYHAQVQRVEPTSFVHALTELGVNPKEKKYKSESFFKNIKLTEGETKLVFRSVKTSQPNLPQEQFSNQIHEYVSQNFVHAPVNAPELPVNYLLWHTLDINGFNSFIRFALSCIETGNLVAFEYNSEGNFNQPLAYSDVIRNLKLVETVVYHDWDTGKQTENEVLREPSESNFDEYIILELHSNERIYPIAISPGLSTERFYDIKAKHTIWIPFTQNFLSELEDIEIHTFKNERQPNFFEFFTQKQYSGDIINEKAINSQL